MSERQKERVGPIPEQGEQPNPGGDPADFLQLVKQANEATPEDKLKLTGGLIDTLIAMRAPGNERAEARAVLGQLDLKALTGLVDPQGRSARREAVETVLALGFPYALAVTPEDLEFARAQEAAEELVESSLPKLRNARRAASWLGFSSAALQLGLLFAHGLNPPEEFAMMTAATGAAAGWAFWQLSRFQLKQRDTVSAVAGLFTGVAALTSFYSPAFFGGPNVLAMLAAVLPLAGAFRLALASSQAPRMPGEG